MRRFFLAYLLFTGFLASCTPRTSTLGVNVTPVLVKVSEGVARGGAVTVQGRYLGGAQNTKVILGANDSGAGGYTIPANAIQSWTDTQIVFTVPSDAPLGGSWLFVEGKGGRSNGLTFSVYQ